MSCEPFSHRSDRFHADYRALHHQTQATLGTSSTCVFVPGGGWFGIEATIYSVARPGDKVVAVANGFFGKEIARLARHAGLHVAISPAKHDRPFDLDHLNVFLRRHANARVVFLVAHETGSGLSNDTSVLVPLARAACPDALIVVDAVSLVPAHEFDADALGIDVLIASSGKAMMGPHGLAVVSLSEPARRAIAADTTAPKSLSLRDALAYHARDEMAVTPQVGVHAGLQVALRLLKREGRRRFLARHWQAATTVRDGLSDLGIDAIAPPSHASPALTAFRLPPWAGSDVRPILAALEERFGVAVGTGRTPDQTSVVRICHSGWFEPAEIEAAVAAVQQVLLDQIPRGRRG